MIYFYSSSNKKDKLKHPVTIVTDGGENKAYALAYFNFRKHNMIGSPKLIDVQSKGVYYSKRKITVICDSINIDYNSLTKIK